MFGWSRPLGRPHRLRRAFAGGSNPVETDMVKLNALSFGATSWGEPDDAAPHHDEPGHAGPLQPQVGSMASARVEERRYW